jgi:Cft2 family RNA processing exonuclease
MSRLVPISGLIEKAPACFLVETDGARLLLDFGEGPPSGHVPDLKKIGRVDALLFSHQHADHIGAVSQIEEIGTPQLFATEIVARALPADISVSSYLPISGTANVLGIPIRTGRSGHAPGGVWIHVGIGDGLLYMGDNCTSSLLYAHDAPPHAGTIILDASYGIDDKPLSISQAALDDIAATGPLLLPVVTQGRGAEIALHFLRQGIMPSLDDAIRAAIIGLRSECVIPSARAELAALADAPPIPDDPEGVMLTAPALAERGTSKALIDKWRDDARLQIVFTGYLDPSSPAAKLVSDKRARVVRWKIHPSLSENAETVRAVAAKTVLPCFGGDATNLGEWQKAFAPARVVIENTAIEI